MPIKGTIGTDHFPKNNFLVQVSGIATDLTVISIGDLEQELETATLSDRRVVSGGNTKAFEFDMVMPSHHLIEQKAMEVWWRDSQQPVALDYKKPVTITMFSNSGTVVKSWGLAGVFTKKRHQTGFDMENEGEDGRATWTMSCDEIVAL